MEGISRKVISVKKIESFRDYKKLKLQEEFLAKNLSSTIKGLKIDADLIRQINEDDLKSEATAPRQSNMPEILSVVKELKWLKSIIQDADPSAITNLDVTDCGLRLTKLSNKIEDFKKQRSEDLGALALDQESLDSDLKDFERTIFAERTIKPFAKNTVERKCPTRSEVNDEFTEFVARTGHTQGWSDEDHSIFLKTRKKHESVPQLVTELKKKRPHLTNEEIVNHEAWQKLYTELREKRKKEIAEWRSRNLKNGINNISTSVSTSADNIQIKRNVMKGRREKSGDLNSNIDKKKLMIDEWRAEKARKSAMDEEQRNRLEKLKIEEEKRKRESRRIESRMKLMNYNKVELVGSKSSKDEIIQPIFKTNRADSVRLIKSFREQDKKYLEKRMSSLKVSKKLADDEKSSTNQTPIKEYSTLFKPTKVWEEKCKPDIKTDNIFSRVNYVKDIQRLSTTTAGRY